MLLHLCPARRLQCKAKTSQCVWHSHKMSCAILSLLDSSVRSRFQQCLAHQCKPAWTGNNTSLPLRSSASFIELEIPPDFGNGLGNAGIPLARLLWHVPAQGLMTLLAGLLLERRVILVAPSTDMVSAAVHAAAALLYPFTWQHIYLPLLPMSLKVGPQVAQTKPCQVPR